MSEPSSEKQLEELGSVLLSPERSMSERFSALFALRSIGGDGAATAIASAFSDDSALLKHELAFCLGQMGARSAVPVLSSTLATVSEDAMVRHEAAEALGAIGDVVAVDLLRRFAEDPCQEVAETCQLALQRIEWANSADAAHSESPFGSVDPTPALPKDAVDVETLGRRLVSPSEPLWERYRAMFALRNAGTAPAIAALVAGLQSPDSALLRHEVAYVLGQTESPEALDGLAAVLADKGEAEMVRHEAAEAIGAIGTAEAEAVLAAYKDDPSRVVAESVAVALHISDLAQQPFSPLITKS